MYILKFFAIMSGTYYQPVEALLGEFGILNIISLSLDHIDNLGRLKVPVLLTKTNETDTKILDEIKRLKAKEVIIIGGVNAVSKKVEDQLKAKGLTVNRISGNDHAIIT